MSYKIGVGLLVEDDSFNTLRDIELSMLSQNNNFDGIGQPPHVTIKRPFGVESLEDIDRVNQGISTFAKKCTPLNIELNGLSSFGKETIFVEVEKTDELTKMHNELLNRFGKIGIKKDKFEGENIIFHITLAMSLSTDQFTASQKLINENKFKFPKSIPIRKVGLFLGIDNETRWVIISEFNLGKNFDKL